MRTGHRVVLYLELYHYMKILAVNIAYNYAEFLAISITFLLPKISVISTLSVTWTLNRSGQILNNQHNTKIAIQTLTLKSERVTHWVVRGRRMM